jgi:hypothetical protein
MDYHLRKGVESIVSSLQAQNIRAFSVSEYRIARFVVMRPNEVKPTRFEPPLLTIQAASVEALTALIQERIQSMLDSHKGFLDPHEYEAFIVLNTLDAFGSQEIWRLAYQSAVIAKNSKVELVTDDSYGSLQDLYNSTIKR